MSPPHRPAADVSHHSLLVAMEANAAAYRRGVQASAPGECWDFVVLTAANEKQAQGYRQELALRHRPVGPSGAFFPAVQRSVVVPDPPGARIGSGGATFAALRAVSEQFGLGAADLGRHRVLLIHSGGASQRLPAYSPLGKIFAPLPLLRPDGQIATLFDHLYLTLAGLPERLGPGMLVLAGDVFLLFDHRQVSAPPPGVTALSMRVDPELGRGHGVFVTDPAGRITRTLQKVSVETMAERGATDAAGKVLIDTGLLFFDAARTRLFADLAGCPAASAGGVETSRRKRPPAPRKGIQQRHPGQIDLYDEVTAALATGTDRDAYLRDGPPALRRELWRSLHGVPFQAARLDGEFLHLGTTRQFRDAMVGRNPSPAAKLFQADVLAHNEWRRLPRDCRVYHSVLSGAEGRAGELGAGSVVEHSILAGPSRIGRGSVVSQTVAAAEPIELGDDLLLFQAPVRTRTGAVAFAQVVCGVEDDFKGKFHGGACAYLNQPIEPWLDRTGVTPRELWPGVPPAERTLWNARLFVATNRRDAAHVALALTGGRKPLASAVAAWRRLPRYSMAMILESAEPAALIEHREVVSANLQTQAFLDCVRAREDRPVDSVIGHFTAAAAYAGGESILEQFAAAPAPDGNGDPLRVLDQARALWAAAQFVRRPGYPGQADAAGRTDRRMRQAFAKVAEASEVGHQRIAVADGSPPPRLRPGVRVTATSPVRLDLAGGWTDTPPYCFERGGHVVNVAIDLDGRPPVSAVVRTLREPRFLLESHDLGRTIELTRLEPDGTTGDAAEDGAVVDPFALHKVALRLSGLLPEKGTDVARHLRSLGAGLHVVTESRVPKGSGLGTSSILAATLLAALHDLRGRKLPPSELIEHTLLLEQRLSTGGGWQDQIGGAWPGVKSATTAPGVPQRPKVERLRLSAAQYAGLQERLVVYYTGRQRLARDILRRVMGRWLAREPAFLLLAEQLKHGAAALRAALLRGRWATAADHVARYWQIKKELYPGSTTPAIDLLFFQTRDDYQAAGLAGAGGGGFAYFLCRDRRQAARLRARLFEQSAVPGSMGNVYATQINREGLRVVTERVE